jgi:hypothetical protein
MVRSLVAVIAGIFALAPGAYMGYLIGPWLLGHFCPPPNGPNLCVLGGTIALIAITAVVFSLIVGYLVARALKTEAPNILESIDQ